MGRLIGLILIVAVVAWLAMKQVGDTTKTVDDAASAAGVTLRPDDSRPPSQRISEQVGQQVESTIAAGKARLDADCAVSDDCPR